MIVGVLTLLLRLEPTGSCVVWQILIWCSSFAKQLRPQEAEHSWRGGSFGKNVFKHFDWFLVLRSLPYDYHGEPLGHASHLPNVLLYHSCSINRAWGQGPHENFLCESLLSGPSLSCEKPNKSFATFVKSLDIKKQWHRTLDTRREKTNAKEKESNKGAFSAQDHEDQTG